MAPTVRATGPGAALAFLRAYQHASDDADISIGVGTPDKGAAYFVTCSVSSVHAALTPDEARKLAGSAEAAMRKYGAASDGLGLADLILGLRAAADRAEAYGTTPEDVTQHNADGGEGEWPSGQKPTKLQSIREENASG